MVRKKSREKTIVRTTRVIEPEDVEPDPFERARREFADAAEGVTLKVYRYDEEGAPKYLKQVSYNSDVHNPEWIRARWGPGSYQLRFHSGEQAWSQTIAIAADAPLAGPPLAAAASPAAPAPSEAFFTFLARQNAILLQAIVSGRGGAAAPATGGESVVAQLVQGQQQLNNTLLTAMLNRGDTTTTLVSGVERVLEIIRDQGVEAGDGSFLSALPRLAEKLLPLLADWQSRASAAAPPARPVTVNPPIPIGPGPAPAPSAPAPAGTAPQPNPPTEEEMQFLIEAMLKARLPSVYEAAEQDEDAKDVAAEILEEVAPKYWHHFDTLTSDYIVSLEPRLGAHKTWIEQIVKVLKESGAPEKESAHDEV